MKKTLYFLIATLLFVFNSAFASVAPQTGACDSIKLRSGEIISAKDVSLGINDVSYKKCDDPSGIVFKISKKDVAGIEYASGKSSIFHAETSSAPRKKVYSKAHGMAITALLMGIASLFIPYFFLALALGICAIVLGAVAHKRISTQPEGAGDATMSIIGIIFGMITVLVMLILAGAGKVNWNV